MSAALAAVTTGPARRPRGGDRRRAPTAPVVARPFDAGELCTGRRRLDAILRDLARRDPATARHSAAVARYAHELAAATGAAAPRRRLVHVAALLHDVGKLNVPRSILQAAGPLSELDWAIVRCHPAAGAELVARLPGCESIAQAIRHHHEWIDGSGYPGGLAGAEIPWASRVISVADAYEAMTARDSYVQRKSGAAAVAELRRVAGRQLDAALVEHFVELVAEQHPGRRRASV